MAYKQDGFLTSLLTNFRKGKDFKTDAKKSLGAYNKESNTVNVKQGEEIIKMPMRKYTKKALENEPKSVVNTTSHDQRVGNLTYNMEFSDKTKPSQPTSSKEKQKKIKAKRQRRPHVPKTKQKGLYLKKGKFIN